MNKKNRFYSVLMPLYIVCMIIGVYLFIVGIKDKSVFHIIIGFTSSLSNTIFLIIGIYNDE